MVPLVYIELSHLHDARVQRGEIKNRHRVGVVPPFGVQHRRPLEPGAPRAVLQRPRDVFVQLNVGDADAVGGVGDAVKGGEKVPSNTKGIYEGNIRREYTKRIYEGNTRRRV